MPSNRNLKFISILLLLIGFCFVVVNFSSPRTVLVQTSVQVPNQVRVPNERSLGSSPSFALNSSGYEYYHPVAVMAGQTFKMTWSSNTSLTAYILTENQFSSYQSNQVSYAINYQAAGSGRTGTLTYDVQVADNYSALIGNVGSFLGGASAQVYQFTESSISYINQTQYTKETQIVPQNDNLYLYLAFVVMISGILMFYFLQKAFPNKNARSTEDLPKQGIPPFPIMQESKKDFEQPYKEHYQKTGRKEKHSARVSDELLLRCNLLSKFIIHKKQALGTVYGVKMFGKSKRQIRNVTFVQPPKGEVYFYTPIAYATNLQNSEEKKGKQVFNDSDLALAGKLKLIFEREKMTWFELKEEKSTTPSKDEHFFALYYYPLRLVARRASSFDEKATLQDIKKLFDFIVTEDQTRLAEVQQPKSPSAYGSIAGEPREESEAITIAAARPKQ